MYSILLKTTDRYTIQNILTELNKIFVKILIFKVDNYHFYDRLSKNKTERT